MENSLQIIIIALPALIVSILQKLVVQSSSVSQRFCKSCNYAATRTWNIKCENLFSNIF